ncbi:MAG TPA: D-alanyl-D-alanine carboxypeptidase/D-alanyl-D-alanine-endopeptidase [Longimicrobiales bacterium]|nr:D-alanyl-D-alanine carboxypeptidase/D-alanyl-D-alanine-endopeptidase [Longimicrobiales bacterium]
MQPHRASFLFIGLTLFGCASGGGSRSEAGRPPLLLGLPGVVDSVRNTPPLDRMHWGVGAYDHRADRMLLRVNVDRHFVPASNMKLVTTAVALGRLGPEFRYVTTVHAENLQDGAASSLVVTGSGDPTLSARFHGEPLAALRMLADSIARSGVRRVDGPLVIDATYFDAQRIHPSWEVGDLDWYYAAPVGAFAIDEATMTLIVSPAAEVGQPGSVTALAPEGLIAIEDSLVTDTAFSRNEVGFVRTPGTDAIRFTGRVPVNATPDTIHLPVHDPAAFAGQALMSLLRERGVEITGELIVVNADSPVETAGRWNTQLARFQPVAAWASAPLRDIVEAILEASQNWIAEQLWKTLGAELGEAGAWEQGAEVAQRYLVDVVGIDSAAFHLVDGSGLSVQNLLSPDAIMRLLFHAGETDWGGIYRAAMAEPGEVESTLETRLVAYEGRVFAKTGTITHVNSLSGYLVAHDGREIIFSILSNGSGVPSSLVRGGIDRIVAVLAAVGAPPPPPPEMDRRLAP